jgi:hypothetical protein
VPDPHDRFKRFSLSPPDLSKVFQPFQSFSSRFVVGTKSQEVQIHVIAERKRNFELAIAMIIVVVVDVDVKVAIAVSVDFRSVIVDAVIVVGPADDVADAHCRKRAMLARPVVIAVARISGCCRCRRGSRRALHFRRKFFKILHSNQIYFCSCCVGWKSRYKFFLIADFSFFLGLQVLRHHYYHLHSTAKEI